MIDKPGRQMLKIAAVGAFVGPAILLMSDAVHIFVGYSFQWTIGLWVAFMLMIPAIIGLTYLAASRGSGLAIPAGCFAFFGLVAGAGMQALFRVHAVLEEQGQTRVVDQLKQTLKLVLTTQSIGLGWPIGLLLFAIASLKAWPRNYLLPALFVVGAISFPIGRIAGSSVAVLISGAAFVILFGVIGRKLLAAAEAPA
jgi:hypothetical protein